MSAPVLWGEGNPEFVIYAQGYEAIIVLNPVADFVDHSEPDMIEHVIAGGKRDWKHRGFRVKVELYFDKLTQAQAINIRNLINATAREQKIWFRPHKDFQRGFFVTVNLREGWNFDNAFRKLDNGLAGWLVMESEERISILDETLNHYPGYVGVSPLFASV